MLEAFPRFSSWYHITWVEDQIFRVILYYVVSSRPRLHKALCCVIVLLAVYMCNHGAREAGAGWPWSSPARQPRWAALALLRETLSQKREDKNIFVYMYGVCICHIHAYIYTHCPLRTQAHIHKHTYTHSMFYYCQGKYLVVRTWVRLSPRCMSPFVLECEGLEQCWLWGFMAFL